MVKTRSLYHSCLPKANNHRDNNHRGPAGMLNRRQTQSLIHLSSGAMSGHSAKRPTMHGPISPNAEASFGSGGNPSATAEIGIITHRIAARLAVIRQAETF
jgi:hypothetical protein